MKSQQNGISLAGDQGDVGAQFSLAQMYESGEGVIQDNKESAKWYHLAADQGHARAQYKLRHDI